MKGPTLSVLPPAIIQYNENYVKETILFNIANHSISLYLGFFFFLGWLTYKSNCFIYLFIYL